MMPGSPMGIQWRIASLRSLFSAWAALPPLYSYRNSLLTASIQTLQTVTGRNLIPLHFQDCMIRTRQRMRHTSHPPLDPKARFLLLLDFCARQNLSYCSPVVSPKSSKVLKWVWSVIGEDLKYDNSVLMPRMSLYPHCLILIGFKHPVPIGSFVRWFSCL